jgi:hypothetical protein
MLIVEALFNKKVTTFMTNNDGCYLFERYDDGSTRQISCESGFNKIRRMKKTIREHLRYHYDIKHGAESNGSYPKIVFDITRFHS